MDSKALYDKLASLNLGTTPDDTFRQLGFANGRQGAIDFMDQARKQYDPMTIASNAQAMQIQANQPAIQTYQQMYNPDTGTGTLKDQYKSLLDQINTQFTPIQNQVITTANNELGKRGITGDSSYGQQQIQGAQIPVEGAKAVANQQANQAYTGDIASIAGQIAGLKQGNVPNALSFAGGLSGAQIGATGGITQAQQYAAAQVAAANAQPYAPVGISGLAVNRNTGGYNTSGIQNFRNLLNNP